jgi:hypothetical protein
MRFGRLAGNDSVNTVIYQCLDIIDSRDAITFVRRFRSEIDPQRLHTFRELIFGAELFLRGLRPRYEQALGMSTPDWTLCDTSGAVLEIIDVVTLHPTYEIGKDIAAALRRGRIWTGWITTAPDRLYQKLRAKFGSYTTVAGQKQVAFVVALFSEFTAPIDTEEVAHVVFDLHGGLFKDYAQVSGVIHFESSNGSTTFPRSVTLSRRIHHPRLPAFWPSHPMWPNLSVNRTRRYTS